MLESTRADHRERADALIVTDAPVVPVISLNVTFITNSFSPDQGISGGLLLNQRVGAQVPLADGNTIPWPGGTDGAITLGLANQWRFYVLTNDQNYTNAAFLTFLPVNLSLPRLGVNQTNLTNATRAEADIDLGGGPLEQAEGVDERLGHERLAVDLLGLEFPAPGCLPARHQL